MFQISINHHNTDHSTRQSSLWAGNGWLHWVTVTVKSPAAGKSDNKEIKLLSTAYIVQILSLLIYRKVIHYHIAWTNISIEL